MISAIIYPQPAFFLKRKRKDGLYQNECNFRCNSSTLSARHFTGHYKTHDYSIFVQFYCELDSDSLSVFFFQYLFIQNVTDLTWNDKNLSLQKQFLLFINYCSTIKEQTMDWTVLINCHKYIYICYYKSIQTPQSSKCQNISWLFLVKNEEA